MFKTGKYGDSIVSSEPHYFLLDLSDISPAFTLADGHRNGYGHGQSFNFARLRLLIGPNFRSTTEYISERSSASLFAREESDVSIHRTELTWRGYVFPSCVFGTTRKHWE